MKIKPNYLSLIAVSSLLLVSSTSAQMRIAGYYDGRFPSASTTRAIEFYVSESFVYNDFRLQQELNGTGSSSDTWSNAVANISSTNSGRTHNETINPGFWFIFANSTGKDFFATQYSLTETVAGEGIWNNGWQYSIHGGISGTGNDSFRIINRSTNAVIDQMGDPADTSTWLHTDDYIYRNDNIAANAGNFDVNNWTVSTNAFPTTSSGGSDTLLYTAYPAGTFVPEPNNYALIAAMFALVSVMFQRRSVK